MRHRIALQIYFAPLTEHAAANEGPALPRQAPLSPLGNVKSDISFSMQEGTLFVPPSARHDRLR